MVIYISDEALVAEFNHVTIRNENLERLFPVVEGLGKPKIFTEHSNYPVGDQILFWLVVSALNFHFFPHDGHAFQVEHGGEILSGSTALRSALSGFQRSDEPLMNTLRKLSEDEFYSGISNREHLAYMEKRFFFIKEVVDFIDQQYGGSPLDLLKCCGNSALKLVALLNEALEAFSDVINYGSKEYLIGKKAKYLASMLYHSGPRIDECNFFDIDKLTLLSDYRLPQLLRHYGVLSYSDELAGLINAGVEIPVDSDYEKEIRIATLMAGSLMVVALRKQGVKINAIELDQALWFKAKDLETKMRPFHRTFTTRY